MVIKQFSILLGSINQYSYLGHSQRMFALAHSFLNQDVEVAWVNPPSCAFWKNRKFITNHNVTRRLTPFFSITYDKINNNSTLPIFDFWGPPKYDKNGLALNCMRSLERIHSFVLSKTYSFDAFLFDSPVFLDLAKSLKKNQKSLIIYHSPDDYFAYSEIGNQFKQLEKDIVKVADIIITPTESIRQNILKRNRQQLDIRVIPNGVLKSAIAKTPPTTSNSPPRIGFVGTLASWVDIELIFDIAAKMPACDFIIVGDGPSYASYKQKAPSNCKFAGRISMAKRNEVISSFDVGLIPFKLVSLANSSFPLKLLEYFGRGIPVVSSPLTEVKNIAPEQVFFANTIEEWVNQINQAITVSYETRMSYIRFVSDFTWEKNAQKLLLIFSKKQGYNVE